MNWKLIIGGGFAYYVAAFIVSFAGAALIYTIVGSIVLGIVAEKLAPAD
jgi:hypothetical protein